LYKKAFTNFGFVPPKNFLPRLVGANAKTNHPMATPTGYSEIHFWGVPDSIGVAVCPACVAMLRDKLTPLPRYKGRLREGAVKGAAIPPFLGKKGLEKRRACR
jgi:hypothetical protein